MIAFMEVWLIIKGWWYQLIEALEERPGDVWDAFVSALIESFAK